jgi:hypothetical protein
MSLLFEGLIIFILQMPMHVSEKKTLQKKKTSLFKISNHFSTGDSASYEIQDMPQHGCINHLFMPPKTKIQWRDWVAYEDSGTSTFLGIL